MEERQCQECGDLLKGRADQKFCNDLCRNSFNNKRISGSSTFMRRINRILKKNHSILEELNPKQKTTTFKNRLLLLGFNFDFHTNTYTTRNGRTYFFCYDQGYAELDQNKLILVKNEKF